MTSLSQVASIEHAIYHLTDWMLGENYTARARAGVAAHVREHGEISGCAPEFLDSEHLEQATEILAESFLAVPPDDPSWSDEGRWTPNDAFRVEPPECEDEFDYPDAPDHYVTRQPGYWEALKRDGILPMLSGGAPDPFVPSAEDWADYRRHFDELECRYGYE